MKPILYGLKSVKTVIKEINPSKVVLVTSIPLRKKLAWAIKEIGVSKILTIPDGEDAKSWISLEKLLKSFLKEGLDRKALVLVLGGGAVGDSVGFAASIYLRGIKYVNIPTTLVAQVDSSHGGKTGINFGNYKNQIGATHQPVSTVIDKRFILSNNENQITDGLGEIIKSGLIKDKKILELLKSETVKSLASSHNLDEIINRTIKVKLFYTTKDVNDNNVRQMLNFGHTIGHAVELKYKISHGKAILHGMIKELEICEKLNIHGPKIRHFVLDLYKTLGIVYEDKMKNTWDNILKDKKIVGDKIILPVLERIGQSRLVRMELAKFKAHI